MSNLRDEAANWQQQAMNSPDSYRDTKADNQKKN